MNTCAIDVFIIIIPLHPYIFWHRAVQAKPWMQQFKTELFSDSTIPQISSEEAGRPTYLDDPRRDPHKPGLQARKPLTVWADLLVEVRRTVGHYQTNEPVSIR